MPFSFAALLLVVSTASDPLTFGSPDVLTLAPGVLAPIPESTPEPVYPSQARSERIEGTVLVEAIITKAGLVADCRVKRSVDPHLDVAALEAVRQWRYKPALRKNQPVPVYLTVSVRFAFPDAPTPRAEDSLLGVWKVRGAREWIVVWPNGEAYRCSAISGQPTLASPGSLSDGNVIWKRHWPAQHLSRTGLQLMATRADEALAFEPTEVLPADSCLPNRVR